jgi:hypothetical protein
MIMNRSLVPGAGGADLFAAHGRATEFYLNKFGPSQTKRAAAEQKYLDSTRTF